MKKVLILCNGNPPSEKLFRQCRADAEYFIAADGGGNIARNFGVSPDTVIGDLDSFEKCDEDTFEVLFQADQESNDLEKALHHAKKKNASHVHILGATGQRLDHTLKNLSVLKQFHNHFRELLLKDDFGDTRLIDKSFRKEIAIGTQVSLFPLSGKVIGITTKGLKYPLQNEALENGIRDGSSNEVVENPIEITYKHGDLLLFLARKFR
ncbi:MAG TPA: thiamine diphosphokinase [Balneolaceae bacterium]|nr:thiamine diphosphokinase [Balneolaceae bacterium]